MIPHPPRDAIVDYLRRTLAGPAGGPGEVIEGTPFLRYMTGILFAQGDVVGSVESATTATADDTGSAEEADEDDDKPQRALDLASETLPSAVGMSFRVADDASIRCEVWGARYAPEGEESSGGRSQQRWRRVPIAAPDAPDILTVSRSTPAQAALSGLGTLYVRWRSHTDGTAVVTVALLNNQLARKAAYDPALALFQVGLRCSTPRGVLPYPSVDVGHGQGSEESEIQFLYKSAQPFARGHGAAVNWGEASHGKTPWVAVDFIPSVDVPGATFQVSDESVDPRALDVHFLATAPRQEVLRVLSTLSTAYEAWATKRRWSFPPDAAAELRETLMDRIDGWIRRQRLGIDCLANNDVAWKAFQWAHEAMGVQMVLSKSRPKVPFPRSAGKGRPDTDFVGRKWRPFQIAFLLGSVDSLVKAESQDKEVVDVIWFPTGGGKTEAYLLVCAFELLRRRLELGNSDTATAIISRYTLRFLTAQQFERTGALIVSLELLRRRFEAELGTQSFTLGLWVGDPVTPNRFRKAQEKFEEQLESARPRNPFLLQACPCCGTEIVPAGHKRGGWKARDFGIEAGADHFRFYCTSANCDFHGGLPLNVVDDALYRSPPSILLGTVDKFAMLPWDDRARSFFGGPHGGATPPSLILQDELHLISGPLGSLAAAYEAALDAIVRTRGGTLKRIAATATIRNAREQVRGLYGRAATVFPSPAHTWDDAYFFNTERSKPGRMYVGVMTQGYIKPVVAMAWTSAAVLQAPREVALDAGHLDSYWTLLAYHNSRRELGRTLTAARDEIQTRIKVIASSPATARVLNEPMELSANMVKSLGEAIKELERPHVEAAPAIDFVPCTSIISVGVDLTRLGVMLVNGQPKLTSEYIQATSRVGRGEIPGLVVSLFSPAKPRDRSHYEDFKAYHEAIYRHVEPTSVTPYALPARERTLHAALVAAIRHGTSFCQNEDASQIDFSDPDVSACIARLLAVIRASDPAEAAEVEALLQARIKQWTELAISGKALLYEHRYVGHAFSALLAEFQAADPGALWPTMTSVRNVDSEVTVRIC